MGWLSLLIPIAYLGILVGSLATFSHLYRQRQLNAKLRLAPYFPPHTARNIYLSLMHLPDTDPSNTTKVPDSVLRAALLARAIEDIIRFQEVRSRKGALNTLLQRGVVGDEIWQRLVRAEQEVEVELKDVVAEANALAPGWGQNIFQSASEMAQNRILKDKLDKLRESLDEEKKVWDDTREAARRELEGDGGEESVVAGDKQQQQQQRSASAAALEAVMGTDSSAQASEAAKPVKNASSDDDAVIVETPAGEERPATPSTGGGSGGGGGGKNKKKKGKK